MPWESFVETADEYLVSYFCPPHSISKAKFFLLAHSVELYLKAVYYKKTSNIDATISLGHNIWSAWKKLKGIDCSFMPSWNYSERIYQIMRNKKAIDVLTKDEEDDYYMNQEFYSICVFQGDIKYLGVKLKSWTKGSYAIGGRFPNTYWVSFFSDLRRYLQFPTYEWVDTIPSTIGQESIPEPYVSYLRQISSAYSHDCTHAAYLKPEVNKPT